MDYEIFTQSVRGSSHIRKDIPGEDFGIKSSEDGIKVFAVADGHGDSRCCRACIGSELICKIASNELKEFAKIIHEESWEDKLFNSEECTKLITTLVTSIIGKWGNAVNEEFEHNPLSDSEIAVASCLAVDFSLGIGVEKLYGTTLIAGLLTDRYLLLLQQGDGRCDVFDNNGMVSQPIPWDDRCVGTGTTSVCDSDAIKSTRYHVINLIENPIVACIIGTDGVEDSFPLSMERLHAYYRNLIIYACDYGIEELERYLETELNDLSKNGSADDVTISGIIDIERAKLFSERFKDENELVNLKEDIKAINIKISSVEDGGKYTHFLNVYTDAAKKYMRIKSLYGDAFEEYQSLRNVIKEQESYEDTKNDSRDRKIIQKFILPPTSLTVLKVELDKKKEQLIGMKKALDNAEREKNEAEKEFTPLKEKYDGLLKLREEKKRQLDTRISEIELKSEKQTTSSDKGNKADECAESS